MNQFVISFVEFKIMFFRSLDDFILCFFFFKILQFRFVNLLYVKILMLSTNSMKLKRNLMLSHAFNRSALWNKYNTEKNNEFCDIFTLVMHFFCMYSLMISVIFLFFRKFSTQFINLFDTFSYIMKKSNVRRVIEDIAYI